MKKAANGAVRHWTCKYYYVPDMAISEEEAKRNVMPKDGYSYILICVDENGVETVNKEVVYRGNPAANLDEADGHLAQAIDAGMTQIKAAKANLLTSPPREGRQVVGVQTWFWLEQWAELGNEVQVDGYKLRLSARSERMTIDPGDGTAPFACSKSDAIAFDPNGSNPKRSRCGHVYTRKSTGQGRGVFEAKVEVHYDEVRWDLIDAGGAPIDGGALGPITGTGATDLVVHEIQAVGH